MKMKRLLFLAHRYLGMSIGVIVMLWCLSGFVMMYVQFPSVSRQQSLAGLPPLDLTDCCETTIFNALNLVDVNRFTVEMLAADPVIRFRGSGRNNPIVNLRSGTVINNIDAEYAEKISSVFATQANILLNAPEQQIIQQDQWTVTAFFNSHRPLHLIKANDDKNTQWYISNRTGEIVQFTTGWQRFGNYFGAVVHWLYPTVLRQHGQLWNQLVIWLSVVGLFLVSLGLYVGLSQYKRRRNGRRSPYRGFALFHHYAGLIVGLLMLTWVGSGLLSMNPGNIINFNTGFEERRRLQGIPLGVGEVADFIERISQAPLPESWVRIEGYSLQGRLYFLAFDQRGEYQRHAGDNLELRPMDDEEWNDLLAVALPRKIFQSRELLFTEDAYYYSHHTTREFPVFRAIDRDHNRYYFNATSGELLAALNRDQRAYRWLFAALHQGDFLPWLRQRPWWDVFMLTLLLGLSISSMTGVIIGVKRWRRVL